MGRAGRMVGALALVATTALLAGCGDVGEVEGDTTDDSGLAATPRPRPTAVPITVAGPNGITATDEMIWVASTFDDVVVPIDPATDEVGEPVAVGEQPVELAAEGNDLWVSNSQDASVSHVDGAVGEVVATIEVGGVPGAIDVAAGAVWVNTGDQLVRIDPASDQVVATVPVVSDFASLTVADDGTVWRTAHTQGLLERIDPATDEVVSSIQLGDSAYGVAVLGDQVWVVDASAGEVVPVDVATEEVGTPISAYFTQPNGLITDGDRLVVTSDTGGYAIIEPPSNAATEWLIEGTNTTGVTVLDGEVWMSNPVDDTVYRVDAASS